MTQRIAALTSLVAFAFCLIVGLQADNTFGTTVSRALTAMCVTFCIGLVLGAMAQKMLDENVKHEQEKLKVSEAQTPVSDR